MAAVSKEELVGLLEKIFEKLEKEGRLPSQAINNKQEIIAVMATAMLTANPSLDKKTLEDPKTHEATMLTMLTVAKNPSLVAVLPLLMRNEAIDNQEMKDLVKDLCKTLYPALNQLTGQKPLDDKELENCQNHFLAFMEMRPKPPESEAESQQRLMLDALATLHQLTAQQITRLRVGLDTSREFHTDNLDNISLANFVPPVSATSPSSLLASLTTIDTTQANRTDANNAVATILESLNTVFSALESMLENNRLMDKERRSPRPEFPGMTT